MGPVTCALVVTRGGCGSAGLLGTVPSALPMRTAGQRLSLPTQDVNTHGGSTARTPADAPGPEVAPVQLRTGAFPGSG